MGGVIAAIVFKTGYEVLNIQPANLDKSLWDYTMIDINNQEVRLGTLLKGKKAVLFVNVASK